MLGDGGQRPVCHPSGVHDFEPEVEEDGQNTGDGHDDGEDKAEQVHIPLAVVGTARVNEVNLGGDKVEIVTRQLDGLGEGNTVWYLYLQLYAVCQIGDFV